jgi:hypothetical protein
MPGMFYVMASSINYQPTIPLRGIVGNAIHEILSRIIVSTILGPCRLDIVGIVY